ncbi:MAG: sulfite exporter TauE/SafE family protein [Defluviitaleaceae bacterium]|nr:sulfite exporter TauE/SafE family protein [Defluviitaleaceae bacterium]
MMDIILLVAIGILAGIISGMGIGGGAILIPALTIFFGQSQHAAQNINLIYFIPTAAFAVFAHAKNDMIEKQILPKIILGGLLGAVIGAIIAINLEADTLKQIFAVFLLIAGVAEFFKKEKSRKEQ